MKMGNLYEDLCLIGKLIDERAYQMQTMKLFEEDANCRTILDKIQDVWMLGTMEPFDPYKSEYRPLIIKTPELIKDLIPFPYKYGKLDSIKWTMYESGPKEMEKFTEFKAPKTVPGMGLLEYLVENYDGPRGRKNYHV